MKNSQLQNDKILAAEEEKVSTIKMSKKRRMKIDRIQKDDTLTDKER